MAFIKTDEVHGTRRARRIGVINKTTADHLSSREMKPKN
jgi:hypothetical protein